MLGEVLHWGGQLVVSFVLVGLAYGWTLSSRAVQKYIPDDKVSDASTQTQKKTTLYFHVFAIACDMFVQQ